MERTFLWGSGETSFEFLQYVQLISKSSLFVLHIYSILFYYLKAQHPISDLAAYEICL